MTVSPIIAPMDLPHQCRPLAVRFGAFGDMVQITALLRRLHERFGRPVDLVSSGAWTRPLLENQSFCGEIVTIRSRRTPYHLAADQQRLVQWLSRRPPGPVWYCEDRALSRHLLARAGIDASWIVDAGKLPWSTTESQLFRWLRLADLSPDRLDGMARKLPASCPSPNATLELHSANRVALEAWLVKHGLAERSFVCIQAGNKRTMRSLLWRKRRSNSKYWPDERWGEVIRDVRATLPHHAILLLGVPQEFRMNQLIAAAARTPDVHNVADDLPIPVLLPLLARSHSLISVDTGPAHAAAALGCPTVALFGNASPVVNRPGGATTPAITLVGHLEGRPNIMGISPRTVVEAWHELARCGIDGGGFIGPWREQSPAPALSV